MMEINKRCILKEPICPYCKSGRYERTEINPEDNTIDVECRCCDCGKTFLEVFGLVAFVKNEDYISNGGE